jgi:hypothetical protein
MFVSKKLPGIHLVPVEFEIGRKTPAERTKPTQQFRAASLARDRALLPVDDMDFDLIAFPKSQRSDYGGRKADGETFAPFGDPQIVLQ